MKAIVPGTYDPVTLGHLDVITRAARLFEQVVVAVAVSAGKQPWFALAERAELVRVACAHLANVTVDTFDGLLVHYANQQEASVIVKGLRAASDYEYELQMAHANRTQAPELETIFVMANAQQSFVSSSIVRELARFGGDIGALVPPSVVAPLLQRAAERNREAHHPTP